MSSSGSYRQVSTSDKIKKALPRLSRRWYSSPKTYILCSCFVVIILIVITIVFTVNFAGPITERTLYEDAGDKNGVSSTQSLTNVSRVPDSLPYLTQLVFVGHVFNVDIKQRQLSIQWQPAGCGSFYNRTESSYSLENEGTTDNCGRITVPVNVYING
jgi:hypothetical protein